MYYQYFYNLFSPRNHEALVALCASSKRHKIPSQDVLRLEWMSQIISYLPSHPPPDKHLYSTNLPSAQPLLLTPNSTAAAPQSSP